MKSYTDIDQSKKLAEILPLESADMHYSLDIDFMEHESVPTVTEEKDHFELFQSDIPCWSLAVLLDVLPVGTESHKQSDGSISYYHVEVYNNKKYFSTKRYNNLIDACYEMILKLHELKML